MPEHARPDSMISLFRRIAQHLVEELVERLAAAGYPDVSGTHHPVFENIDLKGTRLTVLAARADVTRQSMSELVRTVERRGYVERRPDPFDRRATLVCLTPKGQRMIGQAAREINKMERTLAKHLQEVGLESDWRAVLEAVLPLRQDVSIEDEHDARDGRP